MITLLYESEFVIRDQEMIKGIPGPNGYLSYHDILRVPIIENTPQEEDLRESLEKAILQYPESCAVLVRRHGIYVWGDTWAKAKTQTECLDYLFEIALKMKLYNIDPMLKA